jgi:hypothetical protein
MAMQQQMSQQQGPKPDMNQVTFIRQPHQCVEDWNIFIPV